MRLFKVRILAFLSILKVCPFQLFPDDGPVYVTVEEQTRFGSSKIDLESIETISNFHRNLFSILLRRPLTFIPGSEDGYFVVLIKGRHTIDLERMKTFSSSFDEFENVQRQGLSGSTVGEIVVPLHYDKKSEGFGRGAFKVLKVRHEMSPLSPFPDQSKAKTFEEYFQNMYNKTVTDMNQPLLQVSELIV